MELTLHTLEQLSPNYRYGSNIFTIDNKKNTASIDLGYVGFKEEDIENAINSIYDSLHKLEIYKYLDDMVDQNCCYRTPKFYNELKKEYNFYDNFGDTQVHIRFKWCFDGEKYCDRNSQIYFNFNNSKDLSEEEKVEIIKQKTKEFLYGWNIVKKDLLKDMTEYIEEIKGQDKVLEKEKQKAQEIKTKKDEEDKEFIDFCKNFKA